MLECYFFICIDFEYEFILNIGYFKELTLFVFLFLSIYWWG